MRTGFLWPLASKYRSNLLTVLVRSLFRIWASRPIISEIVTSKPFSPRCSGGFAGSSEVHNPFRSIWKAKAKFCVLEGFLYAPGLFPWRVLVSCSPCQSTFVPFPSWEQSSQTCPTLPRQDCSFWISYCRWIHVYLCLLFPTFTLLFESLNNDVTWE